VAFGEDITCALRVHGLRMLAELSPELFPYYAVERLDDHDPGTGRTEPASTAFQLLAGTGQLVPIYQWMLGATNDGRLGAVFELFGEAPAGIVGRFVAQATASALRRDDEAMLTLLAEAIVHRELEASYATLATMMSAKVSDELYNYLAVLLAGTNRAPLLSILDEQLHGGRRPKIIEAALRVRPTPEQRAILRRWEDGD
jgi:hypothetical protein